ncbi:hypothetical protein ACOJTA_08480 [Malaciobacter sp. WC5094]|uniref:hypothetical protein n=1 Tax=Arcobacter sp. YIC-80 TaxID=3376683 RepID=UPI00384AB7F0
METYFLITNFEDGYRIEEFIYDEVVIEYCTEALEIPEEKIKEAVYTSEGLELTLTELEKEDISDDWYVNLHKISN